MLLKQLLAAAFVVTALGQFPAHAQFYNSGCSSCAGSAPAPVALQASCTPIAPVQQTCYQTVPITTYRRERQTVKEPYYRTSYEDREVTVMEPVTTQRTVEVPTVSYQTVTENRTVQRDLGRWQTNYHPVQKCAPCQVDPRPGMIGWLNRTGYSFRSAFIPNYRTSRTYVPRMVACNVPVQRQVAVRGTRKVVVNETKMVARRKTERVEVRKLAFREKEVTVMRPQVAYQTVPIGTTTAYGFGGGSTLAYGYGGGALAYSPYGYGGSIAYVEDEDSSRTARSPERDPAFDSEPRSAGTFDEDLDEPREFGRGDDDPAFRRSGYERTLPPADLTPPLESDPPAFAPDFPPQTRRTQDSRIQPVDARPRTDRRTATSRRGWQASTRQSSDVKTAGTRSTDTTVSLNN